jgi:hypothetical protein
LTDAQRFSSEQRALCFFLSGTPRRFSTGGNSGFVERSNYAPGGGSEAFVLDAGGGRPQTNQLATDASWRLSQDRPLRQNKRSAPRLTAAITGSISSSVSACKPTLSFPFW